MTFLEARRMSREYFPKMSRSARARWVLAKLRSPREMVPLYKAVPRGD